MKNVLLFVTLFILSSGIFAQTDISFNDDEKIVKECKHSLKNKHRAHFYWGLQFPIPPQNEGSELLYGKSHGMDFGYRSTYMLTKFYALGMDVSYGYTNYRMDQVDTKITPDMELYDKQSIRTNAFRLDLFNRFNFGKNRAKKIDKFVDLGIYGSYNVRTRHSTENVDGNSQYIGIHKKLDYIEPFSYGAFANIGFRQNVLTFNYRYSDIFKEGEAFPELPQYSIGLQLGLHN